MAGEFHAIQHAGKVTYSGTFSRGGATGTATNVINSNTSFDAIPFQRFDCGYKYTYSIVNTSAATGSIVFSAFPAFALADNTASIGQTNTDFGGYAGVTVTAAATETLSGTGIILAGQSNSRVAGPAGLYMFPAVGLAVPNASASVTVTMDGAFWWRR